MVDLIASLASWTFSPFQCHFYPDVFPATFTTHFAAFGFDDKLFYIYSTNLWQDSPVLGDNCSCVLVAIVIDSKTRSVNTTDNHESRNVNCRKPASSIVLFLPSSFNIPSSQQIWPCLPCSDKSRSGRGLKLLNKWNDQLSMLTLIMDSGANMCLFNNILLPERRTTSPFNKKQVHGMHKHKYCYQKGSLSSKFGNLPLPKNNYYYDPDTMANLLLLALISKPNRVYIFMFLIRRVNTSVFTYAGQQIFMDWT